MKSQSQSGTRGQLNDPGPRTPDRYLNWTVTPDSGIRVQDGAQVFSTVAYNSVGRYLAWDFLRNNIKHVVKV